MSNSGIRRFAVEHVSEFRYSEAARGSVLTLRLRPRTDACRKLLGFSLDVDPPAAPTAYRDAFGNDCHLVNIHREHRHTLVRSAARVEIADTRGSAPGADNATWDAVHALSDPVRHWEYLAPSRLAFPCPALDDFVRVHRIDQGDDPLAALRNAASNLRAAFTYELGTTGVDSTLEQILETGRGVCQDYSHVMLAIARSWGIPSRYVSGYVQSERERTEVVEAGASHAWAECLLPGLGWVGLDPTNELVGDLWHIPVAVGRDYIDAAPTRGTVFGGGESRLEVRVSVRGSEAPTSASAAVPTRGPAPRRLAPGPLAHRAASDQ